MCVLFLKVVVLVHRLMIELKDLFQCKTSSAETRGEVKLRGKALCFHPHIRHHAGIHKLLLFEFSCGFPGLSVVMHLHQEMLIKPKEESAEVPLAYTKDKQQSTGDKEF